MTTHKTLTLGLIGNPNCGKTTLFNALTGSDQRVGNWPGVTVERKEGSFTYHNLKVKLIDLPGLYSLDTVDAAVSLDEQIARDYVLSGEADAIVNIIDASNIERNLFLTTQLLEMQVPVIVVLNMTDVAKERGMEIDAQGLGKALGCPVFEMVASQKKGVEAFKTFLEEQEHFLVSRQLPQYPEALVNAIKRLKAELEKSPELRFDPHWFSLKVLEGDFASLNQLTDEQQNLVDQTRQAVEDELDDDVDIVTADARYAHIGTIIQTVLKRRHEASQTTSDSIDRVVLNRVLGIPIFLVLMYLMFLFTIIMGEFFNDFFEQAVAVFAVDGLKEVLGKVNAPEWVSVVLADGMGGGLATVASFIPIIGFLFIFLSILEDSGYMARAAFVMDRFMRFIGLPGKSFVPLIVGFGCNVPSIMATRTLENQRDRLMTTAMAPFMSCGARLPIFALFAIVFFPGGGQNIIFLLYLLGIAAAILTGLVLKHTLLPGKGAPFIMELPPYHLPTIRGVLTNTWKNLSGFLLRAGRVIVPMVMVLNVMNSIGTDGSFGHEDSQSSVLSAVGQSITPAFKPMGLTEENWPASVGVFTGLLAKEAVVGTLKSLYEQEAQSLNDGAQEEEEQPFSVWGGLVAAYENIPEQIANFKNRVFDPLGIADAAEDEDVVATPKNVMMDMFGTKVAAFSYLLLILLYFPCFAVIGAVAREAGKQWALFVALWTSAFAYCASVLFYQIATFSQHPGYSAGWIGGIVIFSIATFFILKQIGKKSGATGAAVPA